jgi:hypothetical protein
MLTRPPMPMTSTFLPGPAPFRMSGLKTANPAQSILRPEAVLDKETELLVSGDTDGVASWGASAVGKFAGL